MLRFIVYDTLPRCRVEERCWFDVASRDGVMLNQRYDIARADLIRYVDIIACLSMSCYVNHVKRLRYVGDTRRRAYTRYFAMSSAIARESGRYAR